MTDDQVSRVLKDREESDCSPFGPREGVDYRVSKLWIGQMVGPSGHDCFYKITAIEALGGDVVRVTGVNSRGVTATFNWDQRQVVYRGYSGYGPE